MHAAMGLMGTGQIYNTLGEWDQLPKGNDTKATLRAHLNRQKPGAGVAKGITRTAVH